MASFISLILAILIVVLFLISTGVIQIKLEVNGKRWLNINWKK